MSKDEQHFVRANLVLKTDEEDRPFPLPNQETAQVVIGRNSAVDFVVADGFLSNHHLKITYRKGRHFVEDLNSTHGTQVNDEPLAGLRPLVDGDMIQAGRSTFVYERLNFPSAVLPPKGPVSREESGTQNTEHEGSTENSMDTQPTTGPGAGPSDQLNTLTPPMGLPGWAVLLIVLAVIAILGYFAYAIFGA